MPSARAARPRPRRTADAAGPVDDFPGGTSGWVRHLYLDTAGMRLHRAGYALRLRPAESGAGRGARAELIPLRRIAAPDHAEDVRSRSAAAVARAEGPVGRRVRLLVGRAALRPLAELTVHESRLPLLRGAEEVGFVVVEDVLHASADPAAAPHRTRRLRVEAHAGIDPRELAPLVQGAREAAGIPSGPFTGLDEALALRHIVPPAPPWFGDAAITERSTLGEAAYAILRRQLSTFLAREPGTRLGDDAGELHEMRVASRRIRAAMSLFRAGLPQRAQRLRDEMAWIAGALGEVRDLDVQEQQFAEWAARDPRLHAAAFEPARRGDARRRMLGALRSPRYRRLVRDLAATLRAGPPRTRTARVPLVAAAPGLIRARRRKVRQGARAIALNSPPEAYHALRIRCKRLRYALEFLADVYGDAARELAGRVAEVQEVLGRHQDACIAILRVEDAVLRADTVQPRAAFAMGVVAERCSQEAARMREAFPRTYARTKGRPWRRMKRAMDRMRPSAQRTAAARRARVRPVVPKVAPRRKTPHTNTPRTVRARSG